MTTTVRAPELSLPEPRATAAPATGARRSEYVPALDGLRFCAFATVFAYHAKLTTRGWLGVDLFFCLSAFLLTRLLLVERQRFGRIDVPHFFTRRVLRIWPLYGLMLILGFGVIPLVTGSRWYPDASMWRHHLIPFLVFLGNWSTGLFNFPPSTALSLLWTVSLEEQFYLLLPLAISAISRARVLTWIALGSFLFSVMVRVWLVSNHTGALTVYTITPTRLDAFAVGMLLAIHRDTLLSWLRRPWRPLLVVVGGGAMIAVIGALGNADEPGYHLIVLYAVVGVLAGCALLLALIPGPFARILGQPALVYLGKISYGLYVFHQTALLFARIFSRHIGAPNAVTVVVALALTIAIATVSYYVVERPFLLLKERFTVVKSRPV